MSEARLSALGVERPPVSPKGDRFVDCVRGGDLAGRLVWFCMTVQVEVIVEVRS